MATSCTKSRTIPIKLLAEGGDNSVDAAHERLIREGWTQEMSMGEPGLSKLIERYRTMGYEVWVEEHPPVDSAPGGEAQRRFGTLYTRKPKAAASIDERP